MIYDSGRPTPTVYDYEVRTVQWGFMTTGDKMDEALQATLNADTYGYEGWELWQITPKPGGHGIWFIYRRLRRT